MRPSWSSRCRDRRAGDHRLRGRAECRSASPRQRTRSHMPSTRRRPRGPSPQLNRPRVRNPPTRPQRFESALVPGRARWFPHGDTERERFGTRTATAWARAVAGLSPQGDRILGVHAGQPVVGDDVRVEKTTHSIRVRHVYSCLTSTGSTSTATSAMRWPTTATPDSRSLDRSARNVRHAGSRATIQRADRGDLGDRRAGRSGQRHGAGNCRGSRLHHRGALAPLSQSGRSHRTDEDHGKRARYDRRNVSMAFSCKSLRSKSSIPLSNL